MSDEITQVYIVTSGQYSNYGIGSVWLTLEEAQEEEKKYRGEGTVEVWPIGNGERNIGSFSWSVDLDGATGEPLFPEHAQNYGDYDESKRRVSVLCWENSDRIGIRVEETTKERADKVFGETKFRVFAEIAQGLPKELIANSIYRNGKWEELPR